MNTEEEMGVMYLPATECQALLAATRSWEEAKKDFPLEQREHGPFNTLIANFQPAELEENKFV